MKRREIGGHERRNSKVGRTGKRTTFGRGVGERFFEKRTTAEETNFRTLDKTECVRAWLLGQACETTREREWEKLLTDAWPTALPGIRTRTNERYESEEERANGGRSFDL